QMIVVAEQSGAVSNESGKIVMAPIPPNNIASNYTLALVVSNITPTWPGFSAGRAGPDVSFKVPIFTNYLILTNSEYRFNDFSDPPNPNAASFVPAPDSGGFESNSVSMFPVPHWWVGLRTRVRFILVDTGVNRIVDYVNLDSVEPPIDVYSNIMRG